VPDSGGRSRRARLRVLPVMGGLLPVQRSHITADVVAGITLAAVSIPVVLGYAKIAGMPVVTGLYTLLLPMAVYAVLGSSRHLVVGADSATAAILAAALTGLAVAGSERYVRLAGLAALLAGAMLLLARLARLGFLRTSCPAPCWSGSSPALVLRWRPASSPACSG
jgi:sulfate permease, SulP family